MSKMCFLHLKKDSFAFGGVLNLLNPFSKKLLSFRNAVCPLVCCLNLNSSKHSKANTGWGEFGINTVFPFNSSVISQRPSSRQHRGPANTG